MKTILEITPTQNTSYAMPDWLYPVITQMLSDPLNRVRRSPYGRMRSPSVAEVVKMLPEEVLAFVEVKPMEKPKQNEATHSMIYYDELIVQWPQPATK